MADTIMRDQYNRGIRNKYTDEWFEDQERQERQASDFVTCDCQIIHDEKTNPLVKCSACGRWMCPECEGLHGSGHYNNPDEMYGICFTGSGGL